MKRIFCSLIIFFIFLIRVHSQSWLPLNNGVNDVVRVLYSDSITNKLYVGGTFTIVDNMPIQCIASWNGNTWDSLAGGFESSGSVISIARFNNSLFAGGFITYSFSGGVRKIVNGLAKWNGVYWDSMPQGLHPVGVPYQFIIKNGNLNIVGSIDSAGNYRSPYAVAFDGNNWIPMGIPNVENNPTGAASSCVLFNNNLFIGGLFNDSTFSISNFASYESNTWINHCVPNGCGNIDAMVVYKNEIYLSGIYFVGPAQHIMKFDGINFSALNGDLNWRAWKLKVIEENLYAVGGFDTVAGQPISKIAIWDGINWHPFSNDVFDNDITDIEVYNGELYIAGAFTQINGLPVNGIAKYSIPVSTFEKPFGNERVLIYPNPANNQLSISTSFEIKKIIIKNILGREIYLEKEIGNSFQFNVSSLSNGVYLLILETKESRIVKKFIKEN